MAIRSPSAPFALIPNKNVFEPSSSSLLGKLIAAGLLGLMIGGSTGCSLGSGAVQAITQTDCIDEFMIDYRNRALAEKAWYRDKPQFCNHQYLKEFKEGFISGYIDVASGGNGCVPAIAPQKYWGWRYQSALGQAAVNAWFEGYPMGVRAAEKDGLGNWQQIPTMDATAAPPIGTYSAPVIISDRPAGEPYNPEQSLDVEMIEESGESVEMDLHGTGVIDLQIPEDGGLNETVIGFPNRIDQSNDDLVSRFGPVLPRQPTVTQITDQGDATANHQTDTSGAEVSKPGVLPFSFE